MSSIKETFNIIKKDFIHAGESSIGVKNILKSLGFNSDLIRCAAICSYEGEMNVVMHGGDGVLSIEIDTVKVTLDISDNGPGIADIDQAMQEGFSTATYEHREMGFGAGMGLPNMKKNADEFFIESENGKGTHVRMIFWKEKRKV